MQLINLLQWFRDFLMESLCQGPLPRHLAIIMDGIRRYAREHGISIEKGHMAGGTALNKVTIC
jgi:undecaprenyl pyrophosphate synthase